MGRGVRNSRKCLRDDYDTLSVARSACALAQDRGASRLLAWCHVSSAHTLVVVGVCVTRTTGPRALGPGVAARCSACSISDVAEGMSWATGAPAPSTM